MPTSPAPDGYPRLSPYLIVDAPDATIAFMTDVLGGRLVRRTTTPEGAVMHAEVQVADGLVMVGGANPQWPAVPAALHVYVDDVDATYGRAVEAGAVTVTTPTTQPYGDRSAYVRDPAGVTWFLSTHVEDVSDEELGRRMEAAER